MKRVLVFMLVVAVVFPLTAHAVDWNKDGQQYPLTQAASESPRLLILDIDMASEDYIAYLYLLNHPGVEVIGVTVSGTGEAHCPGGVRSALALLMIAGKEGIPVSCGSETPLAGDHQFPLEWREAADQVYGVELPESTQQPDSRTASQLILDLVTESEQPVSILAVGPLTNIAQAIQQDAATMSNVEEIRIMGGAIGVAGNVALDGNYRDAIAEWNIYIDPVAANIVLQSGIPIRLVPLDVTVLVPVSYQFLNALKRDGTTPETEFIASVLSEITMLISTGGYQFWDTLTAASFGDQQVAQFEEMQVLVIEEGDESGRMVLDPEGAIIEVAVNADRAYFEELLLATLNR